MAKSEPVVAQENPKNKTPDEWEVNNAVDTLIKAEEIKKNEKLWPLVQKAMMKKHKAIKSIADLKTMADEMDDDEMEMES